MNANAKAWVNDLRTTTAKQGKGRLQNADGSFCCLGRACELAVAAGVIPSPRVDGLSLYYIYDDVETAYLPYAVEKWLGLRESGGRYEGGNLILHNDTEGLNFSQIADIIESEPEGLFVKEAA